jgi:hypothetical protein
MAAAAGCGSTVSANDIARNGSSSVGGLGDATSHGSLLPGASAVPGAAGSLGTPAAAGEVTGPARRTGQGVVGGSTQAGQAGAAGSAIVTKSGRVQIGFLVTKCSNCNLLGSNYVQSAHSEQQILQAYINDQNNRGGILGHKIDPVFATEDTASTDFNSMLQSICSTFTEDHHVLAVVGAGFGYSDILGNCLAKAGIPVVDAMRSTGVPDSEQMRAHPGYVLSGEPELDVYTLAAYTSAVTDGWLTSKTKLGILNYDCPPAVRVYKNVIKPYLDAQHVEVTEYLASCFSGASDIGKAAQDVQQAELKFRANGVTAVAITDIPLVVFAENAESQHYYPKYLATEGGGAAYEPLIPSTQTQNIHTPGWEPTFDLNSTHQLPLSAQQRDCLASLKRGGFGSTAVTEYPMYFGLCGGWHLYLQAMTKAQDFAASKVIGVINGLSSSFVSPFMLEGRTSFSPSKHGAPTHYRTELYQSSCACFQYVGPSRPLPSL